MPQNRAQTAREGETLFLIHRDLRDALDLVFDGILDGDDLVFVVLDLAEGRVERGRLAGTSRPRHQHHAVRLANVAAEFDDVGVGETHHIERQLLKLLAHALFVEHAEHGVFAMHGGHDGDAEIDQPAFVAHAEAAVLRHAPFGDIEFGHHLDTRENRRMPILGDGRHGVLQHAVNAVLDGDFLVARFNVNVRGAPFERVEQGGVHQLDHRGDVAIGTQLLDRERLVGVLFVAHHVEREAFGHLFEHPLALLGLLEQVGDLAQGRHFDAQLFAEQDG